MANTKFSTTLIQAGKNTQEFARQLQKAEGLTGIPENAQTLTPTLPTWPLAQGVGWTLQKAGEGLQSIGFDESATDSEATGSIVNAVSPATSDPTFNSVIADEAGGFDSITGQNIEGLTWIPENDKTMFSTNHPLTQGVIWTLQKAGEGLRDIGFDESATDSEATGSIVNAVSPGSSDRTLNSAIADEAGGFDSITGQNSEAEMDEEVGGPKASKILTATGAGITAVGSGVTIYAIASTPATGPAGAGVALGGAITSGVGAVTTLTGQTLGLFGLDVVEDDGPEGKFGANPQPLTPINLDSALVTDAYQQQDAAGTDSLGREPNQGIDPYQAQRVQYEVLA